MPWKGMVIKPGWFGIPISTPGKRDLPEGTLEGCGSFQYHLMEPTASLQDADWRGFFPGVETPGSMTSPLRGASVGSLPMMNKHRLQEQSEQKEANLMSRMIRSYLGRLNRPIRFDHFLDLSDWLQTPRESAS